MSEKDISFLPKAECGHIKKQKASNIWIDASVYFSPLKEIPPSDESHTKAAGGRISRSTNNKDTKNMVLRIETSMEGGGGLRAYTILSNQTLESVERKEASGRWTDASHSARSTPKLSSGGTTSKVESNLDAYSKYTNNFNYWMILIG